MFAEKMRSRFTRSLKRVTTCIRRRCRLGIDAPVDEHDNTLLHIAVRKGDQKEVQELLQRGAHINATNNDKATPLHVAIRHGHLDLIDLLIMCGAHIEAETEDGSTPIHMIRDSPKKIECLEKLLEVGADINARDQPGNNLLHLIIKSGSQNVNLIKKLLQNGSNVNNLDGMEENCLHTIAMCSSLSNYETKVITQALITEGIDLNAQNILGETPLHKAVWGDNSNLVRFLLQHGARLDLPNYKHVTPFHLAVKNKNVSFKPLHLMIKHIIIKSHQCSPVDSIIHKKINSNRDLLKLYEMYENELNFLKMKKINQFSDISFYEILCGNVYKVGEVVSEEDTMVVLKNVAIESSKFYWEIVNAWDHILLVKKIVRPTAMKVEEGKNKFGPRLFLRYI